VPLDEAGALIKYEVESKRPLEIQVHSVPILNLMWPAAIGGQTTWSPAAFGYILTEPTKQYRAAIISPDIVGRYGISLTMLLVHVNLSTICRHLRVFVALCRT